MKLKLDLKKLMICSVALASLVGVGASVSANQANASVPAWLRKASIRDGEHTEDPTVKQGQQIQKSVDKRNDTSHFVTDSGKVIKNSNPQYLVTPPRKAVTRNIHIHKSHKSVPKKRVRKPVRRHRNRRATKLSKRTIKRIMNQIRRDKKVLHRKHASKWAKRHARRNLKKQYKLLKRAKANKHGLKRGRHTRHNHKYASRK